MTCHMSGGTPRSKKHVLEVEVEDEGCLWRSLGAHRGDFLLREVRSLHDAELGSVHLLFSFHTLQVPLK